MNKYFEPFAGALILMSSFLFAAFSSGDDPFYKKASQANLSEIETGKLAIARGSEKVRIYGTQMVKDHSTAEAELQALAKKQQIALTTLPDAAHKQLLNELSGLSGRSFDSAYLTSQISDHQTVIALFREESENGRDPIAKTYAGKYLQKLQMHLQMLKGDSSGMKMTMDSTKPK